MYNVLFLYYISKRLNVIWNENIYDSFIKTKRSFSMFNKKKKIKDTIVFNVFCTPGGSENTCHSFVRYFD